MIVLNMSAVFADEAMLQFEQANQAYRKAEFKTAVSMYEQVLNSGYESADLHYNLGNAYFKLQNIPAAVLHYEKAKRLSPGDDDISYNLQLANLRIIDKIEPVPELFFVQWWDSLISLFPSEGWGIFALIALWVTVFSAAIMLFTRSFMMQRLTMVLVLVAVVASIIGFTAVWVQYHQEANDHFAVVFSPSVSVKSAPDKQSTDLFVLHEGLKVELLDEVGEWRKIRLADGKIGWIPENVIQII
jgi:tetratricopeptide (TPR) repeat protein